MGTHNVAGFTVGFLLHGVERLSPQLALARYAGEALHMEDLVHGCATGAFSNNILPAAGTASCHQRERTRVKASLSSQLHRGSLHLPMAGEGDVAAQSTEKQFVLLLAKIQCHWKAFWWWSTWKDLERIEIGSQDSTHVSHAAASQQSL